MQRSWSFAIKQVIVFTVTLSLMWINIAHAVTNNDLVETEKKMNNARANINKGDTDKAQLNTEIKSVDGRVAAIETALNKIDGQLSKAEKTKNAITAELNVLKQKMAKSQTELNEATKKLEVLTETLNHRAGNFYKNGDISFIEVLLAAQDFNDFLVRARFLQIIVSSDTQLVLDIKSTIAKILKARVAIERDKKQTEAREAEFKAEVNRLASLSRQQKNKRDQEKAQKRAKEQLITKIESDKESWLAAEAEFSRSAALIRQKLAKSRQATSKPSVKGFIWPATGPMSSPFGQRWGRKHEGIDISVGYGSPVTASKAGRVAIAKYYGGYGNLVVIDHGGGVETWYGHNSSFAVSAGQNVSQGQIIARAGSTGNSTGPHVHFEVRINGAAQNPLNYLP